MKNITRRRFNCLALWSTLSASALLAQDKKATARGNDPGLLPLDTTPSGISKQAIRKALQKTEAQVATLRTYKVKRDTQPALILGVFDAPRMFALEGDQNDR